MKKAKILLTAIAVLTLVGGSLAFKASKFSTLSVFQKKNGTCPLVNVYDPSVVGQPSIQFSDATTIVASAQANICTSLITVKVQ